MAVLRVVTKQLQDPKTTMLDARLLFDQTIAFFSEAGDSTIKFDFTPYLGVNAAIIDADISKSFENAIVKLQSGKESTLNVLEKEAVKWFKKQAVPILTNDEHAMDAASSFLAGFQGFS